MRIAVYPLDFQGQGALLEPVDKKLHDLAVDYCARELEGGKDLNLARFAKVWVAVSLDADGSYKEILGITGYVMRIDLPVFRVSGDHAVRATKMLTDRMRGFFQDQGARGHEAFIHISSKERPEQRCAKWKESLRAVGAQPADRLSVKI
ncbi:MAG: hypothetical protein JO356_01080 [Acidobacteria bacterium]|nr:hypothetical protein [Acidobacteriota bacterium]